MIHEESLIQQSCVKWFRLQYPEYAKLLFAVPNGGHRRRVEAAIMQGEGVLAGVSDLILLVPTSRYPYLCLETKTPKGKQCASQKEWQREIEKAGGAYSVYRSFDEFKRIIEEYLD